MASMVCCEDGKGVSRLRDVMLNTNILKIFSGKIVVLSLFAYKKSPGNTQNFWDNPRIGEESMKKKRV